MINKIKDIEQEKLQKMIAIALHSINHKNLFNKIIASNDINNMTSYDGINIIIEFNNSRTVVSVVDAAFQRTIIKKVDEFTKIIDSPFAEKFHYHVHLNGDLVLFIHDSDQKPFKEAVENKILFYNENFELAYIHEGFHLINDVGIKYLMSEFYIGYDFDKDYQPVGKLFVGNQRGLYNTIAEKFKAKYRTYYEGFNVKDENLLLRHYLLMDQLYSFDEIFTQFYGPLQKPLNVDLVYDQLKLAEMLLFSQQ